MGKKVRIRIDKQKCTGCGLCENICSLFHNGLINKKMSAVRIRMDVLGDSVHKPEICLQCTNMKCLEGEMLTKEEQFAEKKKFIWNNIQRVFSCPFNGCFFYDGKVYRCDLCGGDPQCVKVCTTTALTITK